MKKLFFVAVFLLLFIFPVSFVFAQETEEEIAETAQMEVNSYELFWPLTAGRVRGDSLYFLKNFKEKARGLLIFGKAQKADYALFLATKRILEAEKLSMDGKKGYALETYDVALGQLDNVESNIKLSGDGIEVTVDELNRKLENLEVFLPWMIDQYSDGDLSGKAKEVLEKVELIHSQI